MRLLYHIPGDYFSEPPDFILRYARHATNQMIALSTLSTKQPFGSDGRGLPILARWEALDVSDTNKRWVQSLLHNFLGHVVFDRSFVSILAAHGDGDGFDAACLHEAFRRIEMYERGIQCTLLALGARKAFEHEQRNASNEMSLIVSKVMPFLGPPKNRYTDAYLLQWWGISRQHHGAFFFMDSSQPSRPSYVINYAGGEVGDDPRRLLESASEF
jgi:hypothetical protein